MKECPECSRLSDLFLRALQRQAELRDGGLGKVKSATLEALLKVSSEEIQQIKKQLVLHEDLHRSSRQN